MTLRDRIRRLRLYYKSGAVFRRCLARPRDAWWLPLAGRGRTVTVRFKSGRTFEMSTDHWPLLPSACRLESIGAEFEFLATEKKIVIDGLTFYSPLWTRNEASYLKEVLLDDIYQIGGRDLRGKVVVDVGAYVGDTAVAFARQGAAVHAVEPSQAMCDFIRRNAAANGFASQIAVHPVGLVDREYTEAIGEDQLRFVEGIGYVRAHLPAGVDLLKLDCEGAEYYLLEDRRFLEHLCPREIRMEYHRGHGPLAARLQEAGYAVDLQPVAGPVGYLTALRKS